MNVLPPHEPPAEPSPVEARPRGRLAAWLLVPTFVLGLLLGAVAGTRVPRERANTAHRGTPTGQPDYTFSLSPKDNSLPQMGFSDLVKDRGRTPTVLVMRVDPGIYDVTLESDLNLCLDHSDGVLDQVFLTNWDPLDSKRWYEVLTEGEVCRIEVGATGGPPHAFVIDEATRDNRGKATIRFYRVR